MSEAPAEHRGDGEGGRPEIERIAVVFVHGQGEQTPMTDVVELVESVWRTDPRAVPPRTPGQPPIDPEKDLAGVYSQPVYDDDFSDQRRIRTLQIAGRQVDFHQFYWADLMKGNRFQHLWIWFSGLMTRDPKEIPARIWPLRQTSMFLALAVGVWGVALGALAAARLTNLFSPGALVVAGLAALFAALATYAAHFPDQKPPNKRRFETKTLVKSLIVLAGVLILMALLGWLICSSGRDSRMFWTFVLGAAALLLILKFWPPASGVGLAVPGILAWLVVLAVMGAGMLGLLISGGQLFEIAQMSPAKLIGVALLGLTVLCAVQLLSPKRRAAVFSLGLVLTLSALASAALPVDGQGTSIQALVACLGLKPPYDAVVLTNVYRAAMLSTLAGAALLAAAGWWLNESFLAPVMTDSARMFSNSPVNIPNQNAIRERGMKLLRSLHRAHGKQQYDRIIVLAHSLGTVVAYRLLAHYWGSVFEDLDTRSGPAIEAAMDVQAMANKIDPPGAPALDLKEQRRLLLEWREKVRAYWKALNPNLGSASKWKISDFVTIGSPLTYAALLMEESDLDFRQQIEVYKRYPTSPPQVINPDPGRLNIFLQHRQPYHAALFAATCWTNLYFPNKGLANGDLIGGPLHEAPEKPGDARPTRKSLGPGILDVNLKHDNSVQGFTHSEYWRWPDRAPRRLRPYDGKIPPPHVAAMRDALNLFDEVDADVRLLDPEGSYPNSAA